MTLSIQQINDFISRLNQPQTIQGLEAAEQEWMRFYNLPHDAALDQPLSQARIALDLCEEQARSAMKIDSISQTILQMHDILKTKPVLTSQDYATGITVLAHLRGQLESLSDEDFSKTSKAEFLQQIQVVSNELHSLDPDAWKTEWFKRAMVVASIAALFYSRNGWQGAFNAVAAGSLYYGVPKIVSYLYHLVSSTQPTPSQPAGARA